MRLLALLPLLVTAACGGPPPGSCESITNACTCFGRQDCQMVTEACWCASECGLKIACVCGGGKFLSCKTK